MGIERVVEDLRALGFENIESDGSRVKFDYEISTGRMRGQKIRLGFDIPTDFPLTPPPGPHVSPQILPLNPRAGVHPNDGVHQSPFGNGWEYWSRPFQNWQTTDRSVRVYMAHLRHLFDTL